MWRPIDLAGFGVEHLPRRVWEQINLRAKLYSSRFNDDADEQKSKGTAQARSLPGDDGNKPRRGCVVFGAVEPAVHPGGGPAQQESANDKVFQVSALENRPLGHWRNHEMLAKVAEHPNLRFDSLAFQKIILFLLLVVGLCGAGTSSALE